MTTKASKNKEIESAKKIEVEERLQANFKNDVQQLVKELRPEIKALYDFAKSTPEERLSARLSERIYALAEKYERKGMRIDTGNGTNKKITLLEVTRAVMVQYATGKFTLEYLTFADLETGKYPELKTFYGRITDRKRVKKNGQGGKNGKGTGNSNERPASERMYAIWEKADSKERSLFMKKAGLIYKDARSRLTVIQGKKAA